MKKPLNIENVRAEIIAAEQELDLVKNAGLPVDEVEASLRISLGEMEEHFHGLIDRAAASMAGGELITVSSMINAPIRTEELLRIALGGIVVATGQHKLVAMVQEQAASYPQPELRLPAAERRERIAGLQKRLHALGLAEEQIVTETGIPRRPNASAAAVLGLPHDIADDLGLLRAA